MSSENKKIFPILSLVVLVILIFALTSDQSSLRRQTASITSSTNCTADCFGFLSPLTKVYKPVSSPPKYPGANLNIIKYADVANSFIEPETVMFKDEAESLQLAYTNAITKNLSLDYVVAKNGTPTTELTVDLYRVDFANVTQFIYNRTFDYAPHGWYTDPLLPYQAGSTITTDQNLFIWATVRSRANTPAGTYELKFSLKENGQVVRELSTPVTVLNYTLPQKPNFKLMLDFKLADESLPAGQQPLDFHAAATPAQKEAVLKKYFDYLDKNKTNHIRPYYDPSCESCSYLFAETSPDLPVTALTQDSITIDFTHFDAAMEKYLNQGHTNSFVIGSTVSGFTPINFPLVGRGTSQANDPIGYERIQRQYWTSVINHLADKDWLDYAFVYFDEPFASSTDRLPGEAIDEWNYFSGLVRDIDDQPRFIVNFDNNTVNNTAKISLVENVDYYSLLEYTPAYLWTNPPPPTLPKVNPFEFLLPYVRPLLTSAKELAAYWTTAGHVEVDRPALDNRLWAVKYWKENISLNYHWDALKFAYKRSTGVVDNAWQSISFPASGIATYFYPPCRSGPCSTFNDLVTPSIRTETMRDGVEDYDYLTILADLIEEKGAQGVDTTEAEAALAGVTDLVFDYNNWQRDILLFEAARREMAEAIITLATGRVEVETEVGYRTFVTGRSFDGKIEVENYRGLQAADIECTRSARAAGLPAASSWKAWLSTPTSAAASRLYQSPRSYQTVTGQKIARSWSDLIDGSIELPLNVSEFGTPITGASVWTGSAYNGSFVGTACGDWLDASATNKGIAGSTDLTTGGWSASSAARCDELKHLYCFEQPWCGNGLVDQASEQCDDGNNQDGDGCLADCRLPSQTAGSTPPPTTINPIIIREPLEPTVKNPELRSLELSPIKSDLAE